MIALLRMGSLITELFTERKILMSKDEVIKLMESSTTRDEWDKNCDKVKAAFNGYPEWWFEAIIMSGIARRVTAHF